MDNPSIDDNRNYIYSPGIIRTRAEYAHILELVPYGAKLVDLGCGAGDLLVLLTRERNIKGVGLEISRSGVDICLSRGINCVRASLDDPSPFSENEFDIAVCNVTLQMVNYPEKVLYEMKRIAKRLIISIPNFAFITNRFQLFFGGRMPKKMLFGYEWYNTGHIHQMSLKDFKELVLKTEGLKITKIIPVDTSNNIVNLLAKIHQNLFHHISVIEIEKFA